jgi:hypothetical protein
VAAIVARQHGVVTRQQLLDVGLTTSRVDRWLAARRLIALHRGVYAVGHRRLRREGHWLAAVLAAGPTAVLSHREAAALHELGPAARTTVDVTVAGQRGATVTRSPLEDRFLLLLDAHDLPRPSANAWTESMEVDACWPDARLVVELDGWDSHHTRQAFQRDRTRSNDLQAEGWTVLRFTHADVVYRPADTAARVARGLRRAYAATATG